MDVNSIKAYNLLKEEVNEDAKEEHGKNEETNISELLNLIEDDDHDMEKMTENDEDGIKYEKNFTNMEAFLKSGMDSMKNERRFKFDDSNL